MMRRTLSLILLLVLLSSGHAGWWFSGDDKTKSAEKKVDTKAIQDDLQSAWSHTKQVASDKKSDAKKSFEINKVKAKEKADELKAKSKKARETVSREGRGLLGDIKNRFGRIFKGDDSK